MIDRFVRPSVEEIKSVSLSLEPLPYLSDILRSSDVYTRLFKSALTLPKLKDAAIGGRLLKPSDDPIGVVGRSLIWRVCLIPFIWSTAHLTVCNESSFYAKTNL